MWLFAPHVQRPFCSGRPRLLAEEKTTGIGVRNWRGFDPAPFRMDCCGSSVAPMTLSEAAEFF
jgi:hypothetical protein